MQKIIEEDLKIISESLKQFKDVIKGKTFLVTGGAGFLGSWFCDVLNEFDAKIICLDNLTSGSKKNVEHLLGKKNFEFVGADVCTFRTDQKLDYIIHMATMASPPLYQKYPIQTLDASVLGTRNMLELAKQKNVKAFLFTSTSEIYGDVPNNRIPTPEDYYGYVNPYGPRSMYDEGKRVAEAYCYSYFKKFNLPIRIARIFNTYGPRLDIKATSQYGRVVVKFIDQALNGKAVTVYGDGSQTRSFCYITDQMIGLFKLLLIPNLDGEIINIGNDTEITISELAKKIIQLANSSSKMTFEPLPKDDPRRRCPSLEKSKKLLDFYPKVNLEEGLNRLLTWVKQHGD